MSLQPVSMILSNVNLDSAAKTSPNAYAAAQDTGQSQEIIREGIRSVQRVQASEQAAQAQRVHRKDAGDDEQEGHEGQGRQNKQERDSFIHTKEEAGGQAAKPENAPLISEHAGNRKRRVEFFA